MPLRINLLAEAQAHEEARRKDPVKRGICVGVFCALCVGLWSASIQVKLMSSRSKLEELETKWNSIGTEFQQVVANQRKVMEMEQKLASLRQLATNRTLWGTTLNAFQQTLHGIDDVQVVRLKTEQAYHFTDEVKARTNGLQIVGGKPATSTEKVSLTIEAMDSSRQPGSQVSRFKDNLTQVPYFQASLQNTNGVLLTQLSAPQSGSPGRNAFVMFTLQCFFPEKTR